MVFLKPIDDLKQADIEQLKSNKICESFVLDYKEALLKENDLLKEVSAFANTQGGYLVFGVKESGKGGCPIEILGIEKDLINKERLEQLILGNIHPRLNVKINLVDHQDPSKAILVVQIPNSYLKPHMHGPYNKFYKRYQFQATPMTEIEVSDAYRRRFIGYEEIEKYLSKVLDVKEFLSPQIIGQIVVIPIVLTSHMVETSNTEEFDWMNKIVFRPQKFYNYPMPYIPSSPLPSPNGIKCQLKSEEETIMEELEIHRNGCVHYVSYYGEMHRSIDEDKMLFLYHVFCFKLLHTLQFASSLYQRYNYFGDAKIICRLQWVKDSWLPRFDRFRGVRETYPCQTNVISISREFPTTVIESEYEYVTSGIMDEIFNCYRLWKCPLFSDEGKLKESAFGPN
jgi:hypothetical protein